MNIGQLRKVLKVAERHYRATGNDEAAQALSSFAANLLRGLDSTTVAAFVSRVEQARQVSAPPGRAGRRRRR
jgi:hypothetical protein